MQNHNYLQLQPSLTQIKILFVKLDAVIMNNYFFYIITHVLSSNLPFKGILILPILANDILYRRSPRCLHVQ